MSDPGRSVPAHPARVLPRQILARILEEPRLPEVIRALPAPALCRLVDHVGLADAGEILALCSAGQLERLLDEDLWRSRRPGEEERFDPERFALWLEVMMEAGEAACARRLAELPEDLVTYAIHRQALVVDMDALGLDVEARGGDDALEKALDCALAEELDQYRVIARRADGWDALVGVLTALDRDHHDFLVRLLERCAAASADQIADEGGLERLLSSEETLEVDAAADREDRRAREGYVAAAAATSFLSLARTTPLAAVIARREPDPITRAYFRELRPAPIAPPPAGEAGAGGALERLLDDLRASAVLDDAAPLQLAGEAPATRALFRQALGALGDADPALHARRLEELGFLANVLMAGCAHRGRPYRPAEAAEAAVAVCELGLEHLLGDAPTAPRAGREVALDPAPYLFRLGCRLLGGDDNRELARRISALLPPDRPGGG